MLDLPDGWFIASPEQKASLEKELHLELPKGHALFGIPIKIVAHRDGATDDVLCKHLEADDLYSVVHLTWRMREEIHAEFPLIECQGTFQQFLEYEASYLGD